MTFARKKPAGWVADVDTITAAEINGLDIDSERAIDGNAGGTYTPSGAININGAESLNVGADDGMTISGAGTLVVASAGGIAVTGGGLLVDSVDADFTGGDTNIDSLFADDASIDDLTITGTNRVNYASRAITRVIQGTPLSRCESGNLADWPCKAHRTFVHALPDPTTSGPGILYITLDLPNGCTLDTAYVSIVGATGHAAFPAGAPAVMPAATVKKTHVLTNITTTVDVAGDTSATAGAYEAVHLITVSSIAEVINNNLYRYHIQLDSEYGGDSLIGSIYVGCYVTVTLDDQSEWL